MSKKQVKATDPARFEGNGISYRAKMIGVQDVGEARGDQMCQEAMLKLKEGVKAGGQHKQRIFVNVTLEGLRIVDAASTNLLHTHPVHQISFISRDVTDSRAFGYIYSAGDGTHQFFAIKTANAAENLVLALRDLFQTVYEMKKKEIEEAKAKAAAESEGQQGETTEEQTTSNDQTAEGQESIYQVPKSNAPVNPEGQNLLDLEDQVDTILKGIEQIKNLEFDELTTDEAPRQPPTSSSSAPLVSSPSSIPSSDPWGLSAPTPTAVSSPLSNLQQLSSPTTMVTPPGPFPGMQAFPGSPTPSMGMAAPGFGMVAPPGGPVPFGMPGQQMGMVPGAPYGAAYIQQPGFGSPYVAGAMRSPVPGQPGFVTPAGFNPFGMAAAQQQLAAQDPFQAAQDNLLQPMRPGGGQGGQAGQGEAPKSPTREALFGDLVDIKKTPGATPAAAKSPKEMFKELTQPPKKSLNELKTPKSPS